jgi:hypothetical protein
MENDENLNNNSDNYNDNFEDVMKRTKAEYNKDEENINNVFTEDNLINNNIEDNFFCK